MTCSRPMTSLAYIETTTRCNLSCVYCPSPQLVKGQFAGRKAEDMSLETYLECLQWVRFFVGKGTQRELDLTGMGEPTLHPQLLTFIELARLALGPGLPIIFTTNGLKYDEETLKEMSSFKPIFVSVSLHRPEKAGRAFHAYRSHGLLRAGSIDPSCNSNDWAGQVEWTTTPHNTISCTWLNEGRAMALVDGRIVNCCIDVKGLAPIGHVSMEPQALAMQPISLCSDCHQMITAFGGDFDQWKGKKAPGEREKALSLNVIR